MTITNAPVALSREDLGALSRLLDQALDLEPAQVEAWLATLPADQAHLVPRLRSMLADRDGGTEGSFLEDGPRLSSGNSTLAHAGERVGPYRLEREIGRGGM